MAELIDLKLLIADAVIDHHAARFGDECAPKLQAVPRADGGESWILTLGAAGMFGAPTLEAVAQAVVAAIRPEQIALVSDVDPGGTRFISAGFAAEMGMTAREMQQKGGRAKTPAKARASAQNGKKGGRPQIPLDQITCTCGTETEQHKSTCKRRQTEWRRQSREKKGL